MDKVIPFYRYATNCMLRGFVSLNFFDVFNRVPKLGGEMDFQPRLDTEMVTIRASLLTYSISRELDRNTYNIGEMWRVGEWMHWYLNWMGDSL